MDDFISQKQSQIVEFTLKNENRITFKEIAALSSDSHQAEANLSKLLEIGILKTTEWKDIFDVNREHSFIKKLNEKIGEDNENVRIKDNAYSKGVEERWKNSEDPHSKAFTCKETGRLCDMKYCESFFMGEGCQELPTCESYQKMKKRCESK